MRQLWIFLAANEIIVLDTDDNESNQSVFDMAHEELLRRFGNELDGNRLEDAMSRLSLELKLQY